MKNLYIKCYLKWNVSLVLKHELRVSLPLILIFLTSMRQMAFLALIFIGQEVQPPHPRPVDEGLVPTITILSFPQHTFENMCLVTCTKGYKNIRKINLMFMCPCIVIFWYIIPIRCTSHRVYLI